MKKILIALSALILTAIPVMLNSCEEDNSEQCDAWAPYLNGMETSYFWDQSSEICSQYKIALETYLEWDCDNLEDDDFKAILDSLPC